MTASPAARPHAQSPDPTPMKLEIFPICGIGEVAPGQDLAELIVKAAEADTPLADGDVLVVTQKIVSKAEGRLVDLAGDPSEQARQAEQVIARESARILRRRGELIIAETAHGFVCANAGVDQSNVPDGQLALLPRHPDRSAQRIRSGIFKLTQRRLAVIVSDTFGRPWRRGLCDVAIGCAGIVPILDLRGELDTNQRELAVTEVAVVDELAGAAELVMGKADNIPAAVVRGVPADWLIDGNADDSTDEDDSPGVINTIVRHPNEDLFR